MVSVNQSYQDRVLRHAVALNRYERDLVDRVLAFFNDELEPRLIAKLESRLARIASRGVDTGIHTSKRLTEMVQAIRDVAREFSGQARRLVTSELRELAVQEARWQASALASSFPAAAGIETVLPAPALLRQIVSEQTINGALLKDWFKTFDKNLLQRVTREVNLGMASGESLDQIIRRIAGTRSVPGVLEISRKEAGVLVRTAAAHTAQQASSAVAAENADIVKGEEWVATLDTKTCPVCGGLDGKVFDLGEGVQVPAHPNCRCMRVAVTKSWRELGFDLDELDETARASMDGQVAGSPTFAQWLKGRQPDDIAEVLGSKKAAKAFLAGDVEVKDFSTAWGKPLSLKAAMAGS